jgi:hypothetical protein
LHPPKIPGLSLLGSEFGRCEVEKLENSSFSFFMISRLSVEERSGSSGMTGKLLFKESRSQRFDRVSKGSGGKKLSSSCSMVGGGFGSASLELLLCTVRGG